MTLRKITATVDEIKAGDYLLNPPRLGGLKQVTDVDGLVIQYGEYILKEDPDALGKHTPKTTASLGYVRMADVNAPKAARVPGGHPFRLWVSYGTTVSLNFHVSNVLILLSAGKTVADARKSAVYSLGHKLLGPTFRDNPTRLTLAGQEAVKQAAGAHAFNNDLLKATLSEKYLTP